MRNIDIQAREVVTQMLNDHLPDSQFIVTVRSRILLGYVNASAEYLVESEDVLRLLENNDVLKVHEKIPSSNGYPVKPTKFVVSYNQKQSEEFLDTITVGNFSLRLNTGDARYKKNRTRFKPSSIPFNLFKTFLENPRKLIKYKELSDIIGGGERSDKEIQDIVNKEIKEKLKIVKKHFQAGYGYTFLP